MPFIFHDPPSGVNFTCEIAVCWIICEDKILFLHRSPHKPEGNRWALPGGKVEKNETPKKTVIREIYEEIGIVLKESDVIFVKKLYIVKPHISYICHTFHCTLQTLPNIRLSYDEHQDYRWLHSSDIETVPLIDGAQEMIGIYLSETKKTF